MIGGYRVIDRAACYRDDVWRCRTVLLACASCGRIGFAPIAGGDSGGPVVNNIVFATGMVLDGNLGGLAGADAACAASARAANLTGTYVAWLSTTTVDASNRLVVPGATMQARGWRRTDGKPVADRVTDLLANRIYYPIRLDEAGNDLDGTTHDVASGTTVAGVIDSTQAQCNDWTVNDAAIGASLGDLARTTNDWTDNYSNDCGTPLHVYCFGVDYAAPLPAVPPPSGRIAFVSAATIAGNAGRAGADAICASDAQAAGLAGVFLAQLATTQATAASRFDPTPGPWYRVDGVPLAADGAGSLRVPLDTSLTVQANGRRVATDVWTGAVDPQTLAVTTDDCADWTSNLNTDNGHTGRSQSSTSGFDGVTHACDDLLPVYCFQQ
jgi:hypothetical protein